MRIGAKTVVGDGGCCRKCHPCQAIAPAGLEQLQDSPGKTAIAGFSAAHTLHFESELGQKDAGQVETSTKQAAQTLAGEALALAIAAIERLPLSDHEKAEAIRRLLG